MHNWLWEFANVADRVGYKDLYRSFELWNGDKWKEPFSTMTLIEYAGNYPDLVRWRNDAS